MEEAKKTLIRVIILIWALAAAVLGAGAAICFIRAFPYLPYMLGEILGSAVSSLLMLHRYMTLDAELDMNRKGAVNHSRIMASIRTIASLGVLCLSFYLPQLFYPATVFAGLFATKAAALFYPVVFRTKRPSDIK